MTQNLNYIIEEDSIQCSICKKYFNVDEITLQDWNFSNDGFVDINSCSNCSTKQEKNE